MHNSGKEGILAQKTFDLRPKHPYTVCMRDWALSFGDPLALTLAADFRLCTTDYVNDQIWEIETSGDPPALALCTTYGLRACAMRIFPRFTLGDQAVTDPTTFPVPPRLRRFYT